MKDLIWDNSLSVDIQEIDDDHQRLVDLFNMLNHAVMASNAPEYIQAVMAELVSFTIWHFHHEERLMLKYNYAGLAAHKAEHQELILSATELQKKFQKNNYVISSDDINFFESWLVGHFLGADMELGAYLGKVM